MIKQSLDSLHCQAEAATASIMGCGAHRGCAATHKGKIERACVAGRLPHPNQAEPVRAVRRAPKKADNTTPSRPCMRSSTWREPHSARSMLSPHNSSAGRLEQRSLLIAAPLRLPFHICLKCLLHFLPNGMRTGLHTPQHAQDTNSHMPCLRAPPAHTLAHTLAHTFARTHTRAHVSCTHLRLWTSSCCRSCCSSASCLLERL